MTYRNGRTNSKDQSFQSVFTGRKLLTTEQLNKIPEGYNNNIIWNLAHLIYAQQSICYVGAGQTIIVTDQNFPPYWPTQAGAFLDKQELERIKSLSIST